MIPVNELITKVQTRNIKTILSNVFSTSVTFATQLETDTESESAKSISPLTLAGKALLNGTYSTTLNFNTDQDIYHDATGASITFTLGSNNINGKFIMLRLNKPTAFTFNGSAFEASADSVAADATKLNCIGLWFFTNWNGAGLDHVIYSNKLFNAN